MVLTTDNFDKRGGGKSDDDDAPAEEAEAVVEEAPVEEADGDNTEAIVKILEKIDKAQRIAADALAKLGEKALVLGVNAQRNDIEKAVKAVKKG